MNLSRATRRRLAVAAAIVGIATSAACGGDSRDGAPDPPARNGTSTVTIADAWVRATAGVDDPSMTAAFGVLANDGTEDRTVISVDTDASPRAELHEMTMDNGVMVMRPIQGGIAVPAGGSTALEPGGRHIMIMALRAAIQPGDQIHISLGFDDGSRLEFDALAKEFAGGDEQYSGAPSSPMPMGSMSGSGGG